MIDKYKPTIQKSKVYFNYVIKNKLFDNVDIDFFGHKTIERIYSYVKDYWQTNNSIPSTEVIYTEVNNVSEEIISKDIINSLFTINNYDDIVSTNTFIEGFKNYDRIYHSYKKMENDIDLFRKDPILFADKSEIKSMVLEKKNKDLFKIYDKNNEVDDIEWIIEPLISKNDIGILFGPAGHGKSLYTLDMALNISNGYDLNYNDNITIPKKRNVLYIDFENGEQTLHKRMEHYNYNDENFKLQIVDLSTFNQIVREKYIKEKLNNNNYERNDAVLDILYDNLIYPITNKFENQKIDIIFIDNLSNIATSMEKTSEANDFIRKFISKFKDKTTLFFLGHTPKVRNINTELFTIDLLKGSSELANNFTNIIGWKNFDRSQNLSYLVQLKKRVLEDKIFSSENVPVFKYENDKFELVYIDNEYDITKTFKNKLEDKRGNSIIKKSVILYDGIYNKSKLNEILSKHQISRATYFNYKKEYNESESLRKYIEANEKMLKNELLKIEGDDISTEIKGNNKINKIKENYETQTKGKTFEELFK